MTNLLKKIFIFFWNSYTRINLDFYLKKNFNVEKKITKKLEILIVKPFNYSDLYSPSKSSKIDTIKSSQYRMGPISLILDFKTKIVISDYSNNQKIGLKDLSENNKSKRYKYYKFLYNQRINFQKFNFSKFDWIISIKDSVPTHIIKQNPKTLWTLLFEDHRELNYLKYKIFGSKKYDLSLDTTQGFTPYDIFQNRRSINFPYSFANNSIAKKLNIKKKKKNKFC